MERLRKLRSVVPNLFALAIFTALLLVTTIADAAPSFSVAGYSLVSNVRSGRTTYDMTYRINVKNDSTTNVFSAAGTVTSNQPFISIIDGNVTFGKVNATASATSFDTFTIRVNRLYQVNNADIAWNFKARVEFR